MTAIIQSIQPFLITVSTGATAGTAAINAVNTSMSVIFPNGVRSFASQSSFWGVINHRLILTSSVLVTAAHPVATITTNFVAGTVVEFANFVNSIQVGSITVTTATTGGTATINPVSSRAFVIYQGAGIAGPATSYAAAMAGVTLAASTQVACSVAPSSLGIEVQFAVVDLTSDLVETVEQINLETQAAASVDTASIASVDVGRTLLIDGGRAVSTQAVTQQLATTVMGFYGPVLAGPTSVQFIRAASLTTQTRRHLASVVQFQAQAFATTVQRNTIAVTSVGVTATATISAVTTLAFLNFPYHSQRGSTAHTPAIGTWQAVLASTVITATKASTASNATGSWEVVQWASSINLGGASTSVGSGLVYGNLLSGHVRSPVNRAHYIMQGSA
jgi:hypothetical protein